MRRTVLLPWLAFAVLAVVFELPMMLLPEPWRPSAELLVLASAWLLGENVRFGAWLRRAAVIAGGVLFVYRLDRAGILLFLGDEPLLYDQLFLLRHLFVLVGDLWSLRAALALIAALAAVAGFAWCVRRLLAALALPPEPRDRARLYAAGGVLWGLALIGSFVGDPSAVRWSSRGFFTNVQRSVRIYESVQRRIGASPYAGHSALRLTRKPDIHLVLIESYGRLVVEHPAMRPRWLARIDRLQTALSARGWHAVSGFGRASVMGGRSWLAEASMLMGMRVSYHAVFAHLMSQIERVPNLVGFLRGQGYHTVLLAPADRERRGIKDVNYYGYDRKVGFVNLGYRGPHMGWGLVPDQYSAAHTREHVLGRAPRPLFFNFHMVSSHAPWEEVPEIVPDWRTLNELPGDPPHDPRRGSPFTMLKRFVRGKIAFTEMELRDDPGARYTNSIVYTLDVIEQHVETLADDALVILIGDHQPPFVAAHSRNFDTPVHVLARDPKLLEELRRQGFRDGFRLDAGGPTTTSHEGLYSLLVRNLARCCAQPPALPAYRDGIAPDEE